MNTRLLFIRFVCDSSDRCRAREGAAEGGGGAATDQHQPEEREGGAGAEDLQSRRGEIHQPCHHVRTHTHTHAYWFTIHQTTLCSCCSGITVTCVKCTKTEVKVYLFHLPGTVFLTVWYPEKQDSKWMDDKTWWLHRDRHRNEQKHNMQNWQLYRRLPIFPMGIIQVYYPDHIFAEFRYIVLLLCDITTYFILVF